MAGVGLPWASVFDPVANARALQEIQRRGLKAAGELVDRLVSAVDGDQEFDAAAKNAESGPARSTAPAGADLIGVWADLVTRTLQAMARLSVPAAAPPEQPTGGPIWVDVVNGRGSGCVALVVGAGVADASTEVWLHNATQQPVGPLHLHVGDLRSPEGATVPGDVVRLDPDMVQELPARSSRAISAAICAPGPLTAGCYRGVLQAAGAALVALSVELTVMDPA
jgi:hypothetical protein